MLKYVKMIQNVEIRNIYDIHLNYDIKRKLLKYVERIETFENSDIVQPVITCKIC